MKTDKDTREKLEADVYRAAEELDAHYNGEKFINTHKIIRWLDRQAAITRAEMQGCPGYDADRHYCKYHANDFDLTLEQVCDLKREVSRLERERDEKYVALPLDADGVPIRVGDLVEFGYKGERLEVTHIGWTKHGDPTIAYRRPNGTLDSSCIGGECHHHERTIEDVLARFLTSCGDDDPHHYDEQIAEYADELRELMEVE